ncbi:MULTISPECIES: hypothetical protein [unclassified Microcoleus]|uniref:hypothetical protein n=1 Tax=unclassified Microcoleus TaxID=2642155 RepID=UPI002FD0299A
MKNAFSMSLNQTFTANDEVINYQSYVNLFLICDVCKESVFFKKGSDLNKPGIIKAPHFSHYKDSGKNPCPERIEIKTSSKSTDSEGKEQSLEKFHIKIQDIINEGITYSENITYPELEYHIKRGQQFINEYNIDINLWVENFYKNRYEIQKTALSLYHNKSSESQCIFFSNIVLYLCLPINDKILIKLLYYVFVFNKNIFVTNNIDEVFTKVIELISYIKLGDEYQRGKRLIGFNDNNIDNISLSENNLETETVKRKMVKVQTRYSSILKAFYGISDEHEVLEKVEFHYYLCCPKKVKTWRGIVYKPIARKPSEKISITWHENIDGEYLNIWHNMSIVAIFYLTTDRTIKWEPLPEYFLTQSIIAQPENILLKPQEHIIFSDNLSEFFSKWLNVWFFKEFFKSNALVSIYPPYFVKLLFLFRAFIGDGLTVGVNVNLEDINKIYKESLLELIGDSKSMKKKYLSSNKPIQKLKISC